MAQIFILYSILFVQELWSFGTLNLTLTSPWQGEGKGGSRKKRNEVNAEIVLIPVSVRLAKLLPTYFARKNVVALAVFDHDLAVYSHGFHSGRMPFDFLRVDNIGSLFTRAHLDLCN